MSEIFNIRSISQAHQALGLEKPKHPLISVFQARDYEGSPIFRNVKVVMDLYRVTLKSSRYQGRIKYGRNSYDFEEGTLLFSEPGQVMEYEDELVSDESTEGWTLAFHPDLIRGQKLAEKIDRYTFFNYSISEALHLSDNERKNIEDLLDNIVREYSLNLDQHSQQLIISNVELLLDYCLRYYDRQFYTRTNYNSDIVSKFEKTLKDYYQSDIIEANGIPTVQYFGEVLNISSHYLSDLLKKETGKTAQEHIHSFIIEKAKNNLLNPSKSISEIGYQLGFKYPQHFSNLFKSKTGESPSEYRNKN